MSAIAFDGAILVIWKYGGFVSPQVHALSSALGMGDSPVLSLLLPIGISFFTFHHLSYVVDVYRHSRRAQRSPVQFDTYIAMFPQLIAGPIVRYHEIADQLAETDRYRRGRMSRVPWNFSNGPMIIRLRSRSHHGVRH